jgi:hypothetical protein
MIGQEEAPSGFLTGLQVATVRKLRSLIVVRRGENITGATRA